MKKSKVVALIIGSVLGLGLIAGGFLFMQTFSRASSDKPEEVAISDITATSAKVSWKTGNDTVGTIITYGTSVDLPEGSLVQPSDPTLSKDHSAVITGLSPNTTYHFVLGTDKEFKDEATGMPWTFTTKSENETTTELIATPTPTTAQAAEPTESVANRIGTCKETNCEAIKAKLGTECSTQEYMKCIKGAQNPSPSN